jgi:subtilisin family serine protease
MRVSSLLVIITLFCVSLTTAGITRSAPTVSGPELHLHRSSLITSSTNAGASTPSASDAELAAVAPGGYAIVQFRGPITPADRAALEQTGVSMLEYVPDFAYLVRGAADQLAAAERLPQVQTRTSFTVADKLAPALLRAVSTGKTDLSSLRIISWPGEDAALERDLCAASLSAAAPGDAQTLLQIANLPSVRWIEPESRPTLLNDTARAIMNVDVGAWQNHGLFGKGQIIAVADSGLDTGDMSTMSPDFTGRLVATHVLSSGGDLGDNFGHGTHVAGSVAGAGVQSGADPAQSKYEGSHAGVAPEVGLVIQAFEASAQGDVIGLDPDYYKLFKQAYDSGARLHTNSWGDPTGPATDPEARYGGYPYNAQRTDEFAWENRDMTLFFAAGNSGADGTPGALGFCTGGDGVVDPDSLLTPATAKNVITVGASESQRGTGGISTIPWLLVNFCFPAEPISTDTTSDDPNGMAAFSSRGPTDDGRTKPDIVAPGTNIISNKSHYPGANTLWGAAPDNEHYVFSGGTSMATPLVAGAGVLVREWLTKRGIANPSAAAVKATLLNTARDMAPGQYGTGATQEIPNERPNNVAGWGRADLGFLNTPPPYGFWVDDRTTGLATGQIVNYSHSDAQPLQVTDSAQPLRIMLTWIDPPASLSAAKQLVNDLDLIVIGPDGTRYYGNNKADGDRINNVEGVIINNPPAGKYTVEIKGYNVPIETQPYALAVGGSLGAAFTSNQTTPVAPVANGRVWLPLTRR